MDRTATIRPARPRDLPVAALLLAQALGFAALDAIPAWLVRTTDECGGITLVALAQDRVVGVSYAFPSWVDGTPALFSCGLAVRREFRGRGLGRALKLEQARLARARGYRTIRWTADPVNWPALRLYLTKLGAIATGYRAGLHDGLRADPGHPQDDLEITWRLEGRPRVDERAARRIRLPWSATGSGALDERARVRVALSEVLANGYVGSGVEVDRAARQCWMTCAPLAS